MAGAFCRGLVRDVLGSEGSWWLHGGLRYRGSGWGVRGLASPHSSRGLVVVAALVVDMAVVRAMLFLLVMILLALCSLLSSPGPGCSWLV